MEAKKTKVQFRYCLSFKKKSFLFAGSIVILKKAVQTLYCHFVFQYWSIRSLISLYELNFICIYLNCHAVSGILITAKCHMHVSQSWDLYTERKTNKQKVSKRCFGLKELRPMYYCWTEPTQVFCLLSSDKDVCVKVVILAKINKWDPTSRSLVWLFRRWLKG